MSTIILQAKQAIRDLIIRYPQCAYVQGRSTYTALRQVFAHCRDIRTTCSQARLTIHQKHEGLHHTQCQGGVQASLDLTAAFDLIHWQHIKEALDLAQVDVAVQDVLLCWLTQVRYHFNHQHLKGTVRPKTGLRQGCTGSPLLWAAFTALLCADIDHRLHQGWTRDHLALFADDSHLRWKFDTYQGFERAITEMRVVFACFRRFNLIINVEKSKAILKVVGTLKHKVRKAYIRKHEDQQRLLLNARDPTHWISLVKSTEYLGLIISYDNYEQQSLRHRLTKAHNRRWALASVLHSGRLKISYKLNIWRSCVLSSMSYGLPHCGLTGTKSRTFSVPS